MRRRVLALLWLTLIGLAPIQALAQQSAIPSKPSLTVLIEPRHVNTGGAYVQGQIKLRAMLVSPHPFEKLNLAFPKITGARVLTLAEPKTREIRIYNQTGYIYETRLAIFPESSGELTIPTIGVSGVVVDAQGQNIAFNESQPGFTIPIRPINPDLAADWWLVADRIEMTETWTPDPKEFRYGDTVQRHVTITTHGVSVEQLPEIKLGGNSGYAIVGSSMNAKNKLTKDGVIGVVEQTWDLLVESTDVFYISPMRADYWDPEADAPASAILGSKRIEPLVRDPKVARQALIQDAVTAYERQKIGLLVVIAVPATLIVGVLVFFGLAALPTIADRALGRQLKQATALDEAMKAVLNWAQISFDWRGIATVERLISALPPAAARPLQELQNCLFNDQKAATRYVKVSQILVTGTRQRRLEARWARMKNAGYSPFRAKHLG
ncbi:MAG: hypothetical protein ACKVGZ_19560 [Alphaproteobacteria bacterium]|jgi:hypothetical protein